MIKRLLILLFTIFNVLPVIAHADLSQQGQYWFNWQKFGRTPQHGLRYFLQSELRLQDQGNVYERVTLRGGLGYELTPMFILWGGYDLIPLYKNSSKQYQLEQRIWQQFSWQFGKTRKAVWVARSRLEQRWNNRASGTAVRLRGRLTLTLPKLIHETADLIMNYEAFFNLNHPSWVADDVFEQQRALIGVRQHLTENTSILIGYLNELRIRNPNNLMDHILYVAFIMK